MRGMPGMAVTIVCIAAVSGCATVTAAASRGGVELNSVGSAPACKLPPAMQRGQAVTGPAAAALHGGAAASTFTLDRGALTVRPPGGNVPRVTRTQVECE